MSLCWDPNPDVENVEAMSVFVVHDRHPKFSDSKGGIESFIEEMFQFNSSNRTITFVNADFQGIWNGIHCIQLPISTQESTLPRSLKFAFKLAVYLIHSRRKSTFVLHRIEYLPIVKLFAKKPVIYLFLHTDQKLVVSKFSDSLWRKFRSVYFIFAKLCYQWSDFIFCLSQSSLPDVEKYNENVRLIPASFHPNFVDNSNHYNPRREGVVWIGRLEEPKDPILACQVLNLVSHKMKTVFVGNGRLRNKCMNLLNESVTFIEPNSDNLFVARILRNSKFLIITSHFEGAPKILLEGLISGCIVVATKESDPESHNSFLSERVHIVERDPQAFALKLIALSSAGQEKFSFAEKTYLEQFNSIRIMETFWRYLDLKQENSFGEK